MSLILAHTGASAYRPENTMESFELAVKQGADGFELDVQLTKDGCIVVAHDERLERVSNGTGFIREHTLQELKTLDFSKLYPDQPVCRIPTLNEVYDLIRRTSLTVNVELKTTREPYPSLPEKLLSLAGEYEMSDRVIYSSFNHFSLMALRKLEPGAKIGLLYANGLVDPWVYAKHVSADAIHPHYSAIEAYPETVQKCHENDVKVNVWTVDAPDSIRFMLKCGVDAVITNAPDVALACREKITMDAN